LAFISTGQVLKRLGITRPTLQNMFGSIPHLYLQKVGAHLFLLAYIDAYAAYLRQTGQRGTIGSATSFWKTEVAQDLYQSAARQLETGLARTALTGGELAELLGISYQTVMGWGKGGALRSQRARLHPKAREIVVFPCDDIKRALAWHAPVAPPTLPPVFISAVEANERVRRQGRESKRPTGMFGQFQTPARSRIFPVIYVTALLDNTTGPVDDRLVAAFNSTDVAKEAMIRAKAEFERRLAERQATSPFADNLLTLADVAWLFGLTVRMIKLWCDGGHLPYVAKSGDKLVRPQALLARCKWVLPTRR
jgi:hypothetical protein